MNVPDWGLPVTMQNAAQATGNGEVLDTGNRGAAVIQISGSMTNLTVTFEGTVDGTNWVAILATNRTSGTAATTATAAGIYHIPAQGVVKVRASISAWTSGVCTAVGIAVPMY